MFKVIIAGGRDFNDYKKLKKCCNNILKNVDDEIEIICGGAIGADSMGALYGKEMGYKIKYFIPDWNNLGKKAGILRNCDMADYADALIAFWNNSSKGTRHMIEYARKNELKIRVIKY